MEALLSCLRAFWVGGLFCLAAQILIDRTGLTPARILVAYVTAGVFLGAVGVYEPLVEYAGGGASIPLTGFGYLISKGVREAVDRDGLIGVLTGGMTASAAGITAALVLGLCAAFLFRSKPRNS